MTAVEAGRRWKIPVTTPSCSSSYDTLDGVRRAIDATAELRARASACTACARTPATSATSRQTRKLLDDGGLVDAQIVASGGLDEYCIHELVSQGAPLTPSESLGADDLQRPPGPRHRLQARRLRLAAGREVQRRQEHPARPQAGLPRRRDRPTTCLGTDMEWLRQQVRRTAFE